MIVFFFFFYFCVSFLVAILLGLFSVCAPRVTCSRLLFVCVHFALASLSSCDMNVLFGLAACGLWRDTARDWLPERDGAGPQVQDQILGPGNESGGPFPIPRSFFFLLLSHANQPLPHATQGTLDLTKGTMEGEISQREERGTEEERVVSCGGFSLQCGALSGDAEVAFDFSSST